MKTRARIARGLGESTAPPPLARAVASGFFDRHARCDAALTVAALFGKRRK
jgi:hypothetical protein